MSILRSYTLPRTRQTFTANAPSSDKLEISVSGRILDKGNGSPGPSPYHETAMPGEGAHGQELGRSACTDN